MQGEQVERILIHSLFLFPSLPKNTIIVGIPNGRNIKDLPFGFRLVLGIAALSSKLKNAMRLLRYEF